MAVCHSPQMVVMTYKGCVHKWWCFNQSQNQLFSRIYCNTLIIKYIIPSFFESCIYKYLALCHSSQMAFDFKSHKINDVFEWSQNKLFARIYNLIIKYIPPSIFESGTYKCLCNVLDPCVHRRLW